MAADSFQKLQRLFLQEREIFGDLLLTDAPAPGPPPSREADMPRRKKAEAREETPMLFEEDAGKAHRPREDWEEARSLEELERMTHDCKKCRLWETRTNFVFGTGNPKATFMVVGEAPGADEDAQGEPFVGRAGQLLNKILAAIGFSREDVYIANILKSRPPNNRKPLPDEVEACLPYLQKQIALIHPEVILCLGLTAAENLLDTKESMSRLRGRVLEYQGIPLMVTYHPAALLRNPGWKRATWEDVQAARKLHDQRVKSRK
ncbi:MAG TPA: uracil-DNA glycosylase [Bacteroidota bacterium]